MARLTKAEKRLIEYPPTPETWICKCNFYNAGTRSTCFFCGVEKSKRPKKVWPMYEKACTKAGIKPGESLATTGGSDADSPKRRRRTKRASS